MYETGNPFDPQPGVGTARRRWMFGLGIAAVVCAAYFAGRSSRPSAVPETGAGGHQVLYYVDPMNPAHRSARPGKAPDGMDLEPVYSGGETVPPTALNPGSVRLAPEQEQAVRLETETVQAATGTRGAMRRLLQGQQ